MPTNETATDLAREQVGVFSERVREIRKKLHEVVVGQDATIDLLLTCALTGSHALLVGVPGLAKTLMVKGLASAFDWQWHDHPQHGFVPQCQITVERFTDIKAGPFWLLNPVAIASENDLQPLGMEMVSEP